MSRKSWIALAAAGLAGASLAAALLTEPDRASSVPPTLRSSTAAVERRSLESVVEIDGTVGFGEPRPLVIHRSGTITSLAPTGSVVDRGQELLRVDNRPTVLFLGALPMWRPLATGSPPGPDVRQLEENLKTLGHARGLIGSPDDKFDAGTAGAVKRWQKALGLERTGAVELGDIVFQATGIRIARHPVAVGGQASEATPVIDATSTDPVVTASVKPELEELFSVGTTVEFDPPLGASATGTVTSLEEQPDGGAGSGDDAGQQGGAAQEKIATIPLSDSKGAIQGNPTHVTVRVTRTLAENVLAVPIRSLVAVDGGTFAVEVANGSTPRTVPVEIGVFADGYVQVTGDVREGDKVVVPE